MFRRQQKLTPSQVHSLLSRAMKKNGYTLNAEQTYEEYSIFSRGKTHIALIKACADNNEVELGKSVGCQVFCESMMRDGSALRTCHVLYMPVAEVKGKRRHWVLIESKAKKPGIFVDFNLYDPKGVISLPYSLHAIRTLLLPKICLSGPLKLTAFYTGLQSLLDNANCGRFLVVALDQLLNGHPLPNKCWRKDGLILYQQLIKDLPVTSPKQTQNITPSDGEDGACTNSGWVLS